MRTEVTAWKKEIYVDAAFNIYKTNSVTINDLVKENFCGKHRAPLKKNNVFAR